MNGSSFSVNVKEMCGTKGRSTTSKCTTIIVIIPPHHHYHLFAGLLASFKVTFSVALLPSSQSNEQPETTTLVHLQSSVQTLLTRISKAAQAQLSHDDQRIEFHLSAITSQVYF
jgi:hypothetical protein